MKKASIAIVCAVLLVSMTACTKYEKPNYKTQSVKTTEAIKDNKVAVKEQSKTSTKSSTKENASTKVNDHHKRIMEHIRNVEGVNDSTVVVNGNNIIVGLDVKNQAQKSVIEDKVHKILRNENNGYNIHVTSDGALHDRIRNIDKQMKPLDGQPVKNMGHDIKTLIDDIGKSVKNTIR